MVFAYLTAAVILPGPAAALNIDVKVEQPAYAGMPVWLDVEVDEPCAVARYQGDLGGQASGGLAEVTRAGQSVPRGFHPAFYPHGSSPTTETGACPNDTGNLRGGTHRIPLHLVADLRTPGSYAVRWVVPRTTQLGDVVPTPWLSFTVAPVAPAQREFWLTGLLRKSPKDPETVRDDYIPSLLAAWPDQRVEHRLLDFLCSDDGRVSNSAREAFPPTLSADGQTYLAQSVTRGCLSDGVVTYVGMAVGRTISGEMSEVQRERLLAAAMAALPDAHGVHLAHAIGLVWQLRHGRTGGLFSAADAAVLRKAPEILDAVEDPGSSKDDPKWMLVSYLGGRDHPPGGHAVLEALADKQDEAAGEAIEQLLFNADPADIPSLRDRLMKELPEGFGSSTIRQDFDAMRRRFGRAATGLMESLTRARTGRVAVAAALALDAGGDRVGTAAVLNALRGGREDKGAEILNQIIGTPACPDEDDECYQQVSRAAQLQEPWAEGRKASAVRYFEARLAKGSKVASHQPLSAETTSSEKEGCSHEISGIALRLRGWLRRVA